MRNFSEDQIRWGIRKALKTWMILRNQAHLSFFFSINWFPKFLECNSRVGISGEDRESGFPLLKGKNPEPLSASLSLAPNSLVSSKSQVSCSCWVRDWCHAGCSRLCCMMDRSNDLTLLLMGFFWNKLFFALLFLLQKVSSLASLLVACRPHGSLFTCAGSVLCCKGRECMQRVASGLGCRICDGACIADIPCCVSSLVQRVQSPEKVGSFVSLMSGIGSSSEPGSNPGSCWKTIFSPFTLSITSHTTWSRLFLLGILWGGDSRSRGLVYRHILEMAFRRRSLGDWGSGSGARILMDGTSVGL